MEYREVYTGSMEDLKNYINNAIENLYSGNITINGQNVIIPTDRLLCLKLKYEMDRRGDCVSIKISWDI